MKLISSLLLLFIACPLFGAEFLVMAENNWMIDASTEGRSAEWLEERDRQYRKGDIVHIFPDGKLGKHAHAGGKFYVIKSTNISYKDALKYRESWVENGVTIKRGKYSFPETNLSETVNSELSKDYVYDAKGMAVKSLIRNKVTSLNE